MDDYILKSCNKKTYSGIFSKRHSWLMYQNNKDKECFHFDKKGRARKRGRHRQKYQQVMKTNYTFKSQLRVPVSTTESESINQSNQNISTEPSRVSFSRGTISRFN